MLAFFGVKQRYEIHGIPANSLQRFIERFICNAYSTDKVVSISSALRDDICTLYSVAKGKVLVAHDGADSVDYTKVKKANLKGGFKFQVGYVGSLLEGKGVDIVCTAAAELKDFGFNIVGGSVEQINKMKKSFPHDNLAFYGYANQHDVLRYLAAFDVVILPNKKNVITANGENIGKYTSPLKLFEYLAMNKTVIASDIPVFREVVSDSNVLFFSPSDVNDLKKKIEVVAQGSYVSSGGPELISQTYSWQRRSKEVLRD